MKTWKILLAVLLIVATVGVVLAICLKPAETPTGDNTLTVTFYNGDQVYETVTVEAGERVAQLAIVPFLKAEFCECDELSDTVRGAGGFGSTGKI